KAHARSEDRPVTRSRIYLSYRNHSDKILLSLRKRMAIARELTEANGLYARVRAELNETGLSLSEQVLLVQAFPAAGDLPIIDMENESDRADVSRLRRILLMDADLALEIATVGVDSLGRPQI